MRLSVALCPIEDLLLYFGRFSHDLLPATRLKLVSGDGVRRDSKQRIKVVVHADLGKAPIKGEFRDAFDYVVDHAFLCAFIHYCPEIAFGD